MIMETKVVTAAEKLWIKNGQIHVGHGVYDTENLQKVIVQISDLTFVEDTVRLMMIFDNGTLIVPSMHPFYDTLFEKLIKLIKIDNEAYLRAMNCERTCDFTIFERN